MKKIIWAYSFAKKSRWVLLILKAFSKETDHLSNARWFYAKQGKIGKGNIYSTKNRLNDNDMWCESDNHNYMCHLCAKGLLDSNLN